jgi:Ras-related protein Rab-21
VAFFHSCSLPSRIAALFHVTSLARCSDAALLVYDITDQESFIKVQKWVKELRKVVGESIAIAIAGNKADLEKERHVNNAEAEAYAASVAAQHSVVSAKLGKGLEECFVALARKMLAQAEPLRTESAPSSAPSSAPAPAPSGNIVLMEEDVEEARHDAGGCC